MNMMISLTLIALLLHFILLVLLTISTLHYCKYISKTLIVLWNTLMQLPLGFGGPCGWQSLLWTDD